MNAPQPLAPVAKSAGPVLMHVRVAGRVEESRSFDGNRYTKLAIPSADEYSRPDVIEVRSKVRIGERGEIVNITCRLGGYPGRTFKAQRDGESVNVTPIMHTVDLVED